MFDIKFMQEAIALSRRCMEKGEGGPFGAVIVKDGQIIGRGHNMVTVNCDPTAHAEVMAIRDACRYLNTFQLEGCEIYCSCEPCPMCLGAIYWARPSKVFFAANKTDAANAGFDDSFIYKEIVLPYSNRKIITEEHPMEEAVSVLIDWKNNPNKIEY